MPSPSTLLAPLALAIPTLALLLLAAGPALGASYQRVDGSVVDPILDTAGSPHAYAGRDLEPNARLDNGRQTLRAASLRFADLRGARIVADLASADLAYANLEGASFCQSGCSQHWNPSWIVGADLTGANLRDVRFDYMDFSHVVLDGADLRGADLYHVDGLGSARGRPIYDETTDFSLATVRHWEGYDFDFELFDPVAAGWIFVPEPGTPVLFAFGLAALSRFRRP